MTQILIIDDDPAIRLVLKRMLQKQGYEVIVTEDGAEGLAAARENLPGLIISDWMMPKVDGLEVCRQVKADSRLSTTFFILLTSRKSLEDRIQGLDTGADDFLSKPIDLSELQARVRAGLRLHQLTQDLQTQKQLLESELTEAAQYVQSLLPPATTEPLPIEARFIPSQKLGGDCFDYFWLDPDYLVVYLLDMSGHGLGAALPSVSMLNLLRSQALPSVNFYQPDQVLSALNETFQMQNHGDRFFTIWYGVYNRVRRQLSYASAGHPPALLIPQNLDNLDQIQQLKTPGFPIGMFDGARYVSQRCTIQEPGSLYIFSDGIYEIQHVDGFIWGIDNFIEFVYDCKLQKKKSRAQQEAQTCVGVDQMIHEIKLLNSDQLFKDDVSLIQLSFP